MFRFSKASLAYGKGISPFAMFLINNKGTKMLSGKRGNAVKQYLNLPEANKSKLMSDAKQYPSFKRYTPAQRYKTFIQRRFHKLAGLAHMRMKKIGVEWGKEKQAREAKLGTCRQELRSMRKN